jgi:hypothetical protein
MHLRVCICYVYKLGAGGFPMPNYAPDIKPQFIFGDVIVDVDAL